MNYVDSGTATWSDNGYDNIQDIPLYIIRSGHFGYLRVGVLSGQGTNGLLWSSTSTSTGGGYNLNYWDTIVQVVQRNDRVFGFPVRCITTKIRVNNIKNHTPASKIRVSVKIAKITGVEKFSKIRVSSLEKHARKF